ncbi:MAG: hypothetical protein E6149_04320, partial [Peptoniphilus harei]|nr:hypothetical protein [Peptoniphilus harei]
MSGFNPRTHEECDFAIFSLFFDFQYFNPRTHEECDLQTTPAHLMGWEFQSTHPRGVRPVLPSYSHSKGLISIHAPAKGAT